MRKICVVGILAACWFLTPATTVFGQMWPGHGGGRSYSGGYYGYGDSGAWGAYSSALNNATSSYAAEQNRLMGQRAAMGQSAMMQSGIRNTLTTQAETRSQNINNQRQSNSDWWFQVQQQQVAQRQSMGSRSSMALTPAVSFESPRVEPQAATDIIKWLPVLCEPRFDADRAKIEAPYRRTPKASLTAADYQSMIEVAGQMKATLGQMTAEISAQDYLTAEKFLDQLIAEARGRIEKK